MKILEEIDFFMNYANIHFFSKERELSYFGEKYRYSFVFFLENVVSSVEIKKCYRLLVTSMRSGKFPRLKFSSKCPSYHHLMLHSTF